MSEQPQDWRRRQASQITCQLPEYREDALAVQRFAEELVTGFLSESETTWMWFRIFACLNGAPENQPRATVRDLAESLARNY
ncbi:MULTISPECIES: hypothetical protein [unclassified Bradyrhizobium]|uniref:hypothetical protein n=1 Tax=unclassified Bradyrhizobium TaxID=2631580 RepID=UPI0011416EBC|nr:MULTISPECIES: hypothetical protein [unclassified Bradyrhizobium]MCP1850492.1 hypothetical protein [Bradyrhizobium sp. USDA 4541]